MICLSFFYHYLLADEPSCWWYEFYECVRRLVQTALNVFILPGTNEGIAVNIVLSFIFVKVQGTLEPYLEDEEDILGELSQWLILIQLQITLLLSLEVFNPYGYIGYVFVGLIAALCAVLVVFVLTMLQDALRVAIKGMTMRVKAFLTFFGINVAPLEEEHHTKITDVVDTNRTQGDDAPEKRSLVQKQDGLPTSFGSLYNMMWDSFSTRGETKVHDQSSIENQGTEVIDIAVTTLRVGKGSRTEHEDLVSAVPSSVEDLERQRREADEESRKSFLISKSLPSVGPLRSVFSPSKLPSAVVLPSDQGLGVSPVRLGELNKSVDRLFHLSQVRSAMRAKLHQEVLANCHHTIVEKVELDIFTIAKGDTEEQEEVFNKVVRATRANASAWGRLRTGEINVQGLFAEMKVAEVAIFRDTMKRQLRQGDLCAGRSEVFVEEIERSLFLAAGGAKEIQERLFEQLTEAVKTDPSTKESLFAGEVNVEELLGI